MRQQFSGFMSATANVGDIDVRTLPNREHFVSAYRHERTLFITARQTWMQLSAEGRRQMLVDLIQAPGQFHYQTVVVMDENGNVLANVSQNGVLVDNSGWEKP